MKIRERSIGFLFRDIARFRGILFDQIMQPYGLTLAQAFVLNHLFRKDGLTQTEIAELMDIGTVTVSGLLDRLEVRGWVVRTTDLKDRRAKQVWLTPEASNIQKKMAECLQRLNDITMEGLDAAEIEQLSTMLRKAKVNLSQELGLNQKNNHKA